MKLCQRITVIGGGNIGTQFACQAAAKGYAVTIYSKKPAAYSERLHIVDSTGKEQCAGTPEKITDDLALAVRDADLIFVTYPAFMFPAFAKELEPYIKSGVYIGVIPGTGGAEFAFKSCIEKGAVLFGLQRVPCVARLVTYGQTVCVEGKRDCLYLASVPQSATSPLCEFMSDLFDIPCEPLPNYLCVTMTPSNPILHTTRLRTLFADYAPNRRYHKNPLFYGEWSDESSRLLLSCDKEHQQLLKKLDKMDLSSVKSLKEHYESATVEALTAKMRSIKSLHNLPSPMICENDTWAPDFHSRYFTADFPYGLAIIEGLAAIVKAEIPCIQETMNWYRTVSGDNSRFLFDEYNIFTLEDIYDYYS